MLYPVIGSSIKFNLIVVPRIFIAGRPTAVGSVDGERKRQPERRLSALDPIFGGRPISCSKLEKVSFRGSLPCQPTAVRKDNNLDRIEHPLYTVFYLFHRQRSQVGITGSGELLCTLGKDSSRAKVPSPSAEWRVLLTSGLD